MNAVATPELIIHKAQQSRTRLLVWPREHGAWGMLLIPLLTGAAIALTAAEQLPALLLLVLATLALFCLRTPVESLLGTSPMRAQTVAERRAVIRVIVVFASLAGLALVGVLWGGRNRGLLILGAAAAILFVGQALIKKQGRRGRMPAQLIGALGLSSTAPAAYYLLTGRIDALALGLWLANGLFAGNQIHFVQLRIRGARLTDTQQKFAFGKIFFIGQFAMMLLLAGAWLAGLIPALALLAFVPVVVRGTNWFFSGSEPLNVHRLGFTELAHAIAFGFLLILGVRLSL